MGHEHRNDKEPSQPQPESDKKNQVLASSLVSRLITRGEQPCEDREILRDASANRGLWLTNGN